MASGNMVSTRDLEVGTTVSMDHELFDVVSMVYRSDACHLDLAAAEAGVDNTLIEVATADLDEPIWETI